eukprot:10491454-Lingulodinium_polyedra.AAC.1
MMRATRGQGVVSSRQPTPTGAFGLVAAPVQREGAGLRGHPGPRSAFADSRSGDSFRLSFRQRYQPS